MTKRQRDIAKRNTDVYKRWLQLTKDDGSKMAAYHIIMEEFTIYSVATVWSIVKKQNAERGNR